MTNDSHKIRANIVMHLGVGSDSKLARRRFHQ
jgi:hypothetical protein